jgi:hypothetical protein
MEFRMCSLHVLPTICISTKEHKMEFRMCSLHVLPTICTRCEDKGTQNGIWNV